jgi:polygalacturonase
MDFDAKGDGIFDDSEAIKEAIKYCLKKNGGTIFFPAGNYLTGPIQLIDNLTLYIDSGAVISFIDDFNKYPPVFTRWEGVECYALSPLIFGNKLENINIIGSGTLNGNGQKWWKVYKNIKKQGRKKPETKIEKKLAELNPGFENAGSGGGGREMQFLRPPLIQFFKCNKVKIDGITCKNSPFWNTHIVYCNDVNISNAYFVNPSDAPNTDGLDIDSSYNVHILNCTFDVGDDCLCLKSGTDSDGRRIGKPTENITITNCTMLHGHGGVVMGSDIAGGIKNVTISNSIFIGTDRGIRIKSRRGRGGFVEDIHANNLIIKEALSPIVFNLLYKCGAEKKDDYLFYLDNKIPVTEETPIIKNISLSNITAREVYSTAVFLHGLPESTIKNLRLDNIEIGFSKDPSKIGGEAAMAKGIDFSLNEKKGFWANYIEDVRLTNIKISGLETKEIDINNSNNITIDGVKKY